jgi:uncharacterized Ntn-hydrolase superfamily protein
MAIFDRYLSVSKRSALAAGASAIAFTAGSAQATWSILIADMRTGEIVIASATCVEAIDLRRETPVLITGVGAVTAQSAVDSSGGNRMLIRDRLLQGVPLGSILEELEMTDPGHLNRQYGFITASGESLTYSGIQNADWAGGITGRIEKGQLGPADDIVYSVQGNILSGPNVVDDAVQAIINTDTDLPGKLKAAMLAAQAGGGDGRCSCSNGDPTGCGSPPPPPFKSAHVGYMLGTRADDIDAVRAFYPITNLAGAMTLADINHDGMMDVVIGDATNDEFSVFTNSAAPGDPLSHVIKSATRNLGAQQAVAMSTGDFNDDGLDDVALVMASPPVLLVTMSLPQGGLPQPVVHLLPAIPTGLAAGDLLDVAGDEIAVAMGSAGTVQLYSVDNGSIAEESAILLDGNPSTIVIGELAGDALADLAIARRDGNTVWVGENLGAGVFGVAADLPSANQPNKIAISDLDLDGDNELVVLSEAGRRVEIFADGGKAWSRINDFAVNRDGRGLAVGAFHAGDDYPDIITTSSSPQRNLQLFVNDGVGGFALQDIVKVGSGSRFVELHDMNGNGDLDIVIGNGGDNGLMLIDNPRGTPIVNSGRFAGGDYFLELNVANQRDSDPDPVDQLVGMFDAWRAGLAGKVDAVNTVVHGRSRVSINTSSMIRIELRDWEGGLLPISDAGSWSLSTSNGLFTTSTPLLIEPGIFDFSIDAGSEIGTGDLVIRVGDGADQVRLMPDMGVFIVENIADFTADGKLDFFDVSAFLAAYFTNNPDADLDNDGQLTFLDVSLFMLAFNG